MKKVILVSVTALMLSFVACKEKTAAEKLRDKMEDVADDAKDVAEDVADKTEDVVEEAGDKTERGIKKIKKTFDND